MSQFDTNKCYKKFMLVENFLTNLQNLMGDMTQQELADASGVARGRIASWKSRKVIGDAADIEKIAAYFKVEPYYFFMEPGTQAQLKKPDDANNFAVFLDDMADKYLEEKYRREWKEVGSANEFVRLLRKNYETDSIGLPNWYLELNKVLTMYSSIDLIEKIKNKYAKKNQDNKKASNE